MELRQRNLRTNNEGVLQNEKTSCTQKTVSPFEQKYLTILVLLGILFLGYVVIASDLKPIRIGSKAIDSIAYSFNLHKPFYVVIIDAGSTGSRVLAFTFHESVLDGNLVLDNEFFNEIKPGLSSFVDKPEGIANSLQILLQRTKTIIPQSEWPRTALSMKATAGLRLLPTHKANAILDECQKVFANSNFQTSKNSVSIMDGTDEGIFSWFTVNFLLDRLSSHNTDNTVAALDLGGGSTQVTFLPDNTHIKQLEKHIYSINAFDHNMSVFTHSYLGMGLMAARKEILLNGMTVDNNNKETIEIHSECINPFVSTEWHYGGQDYLVKGPVNGSHKIVKTQNFAGGDEDRPIVRFPECLKIVQKYVGNIKEKPLSLKNHEIYAFSYYFERATETGLIDPLLGGVITIDAFLKQTMDVCDYPNTEQPFICLDMTYIYVLLTDGFGLEPKTKLNLYKKINGHELSWALGAAFNIIQNGL